ncbi:probable WRKY transcription factor 69 isoform X2 [Beta vulgaris subsp. vulgaris]|uniref:probable WRKY transcription factor 69 isoform X2 n=1 Tax=Beta vulgaris subsp. vulgaris TaxID=3555 RepID=UPI00053F680F|nr:probable WRKY transcription factor 69 isoform X2 [Beta vulgaris subsp. vulgaris]
MVMENKHRTSSYFTNEQDDPQSSSENGPDSPLSGDDLRTTATAPSPKKRRSIQKRVVSIPIGDVDGSRSKGEAYPPSDSWAWRKYGQKPIKGSPYPRGYYRCSSSKGCPARKQVERSRVDPTMLVITYACEHNHPLPTTKHHHHHHQNNHQTIVTATTTAPPPVASPSTPSPATPPISTAPSDSAEDGGEETSPSSPLHINPFGDPPLLEFVGGDSLMLGSLGVEFNWISDLSFDTPALVGPTFDDAEVATFPMKEEDESLFGDLDELPECSLVFRRGQGSIERCTTTATPICGST